MRKNVVRSLSLFTVIGLIGCGATSAKSDAPDAPSSAQPTDNKAADASASSSPGVSSNDSPRRAKAKHIVKFLNDPDIDVKQRGRVAATGLGEADFGLPSDQIKAMGAAGGDSIDPSQCARIISLGLTQSAKDAIDKRCGGTDALTKSLAKGSPADQTRLVIKTCKITTVDAKDAAGLNAWAVLLSAIVGDELAASPDTSDDEKKVAEALSQLCPGN